MEPVILIDLAEVMLSFTKSKVKYVSQIKADVKKGNCLGLQYRSKSELLDYLLLTSLSTYCFPKSDHLKFLYLIF